MPRQTAAVLARLPCSPYSSLPRHPEPADVSISVTVDHMIVDHADGLHVRVDHRRSNEAEPAALEIAAERVRLGGRCGDLTQRAPPILLWPATDELPAVRVEASVFFLHCQKRSGVLHRVTPHFFAVAAAVASAANSSRPNAVPPMPQPPSAASVSNTHVRFACEGSPQMSAGIVVTSCT